MVEDAAAEQTSTGSSREPTRSGSTIEFATITTLFADFMTAHPLGRISPASTWMQAELRRPVLGSFRLNPRKDQNRRLWMPRMQAHACCDQRGLELPRFVFRLASGSIIRCSRLAQRCRNSRATQ